MNSSADRMPTCASGRHRRGIVVVVTHESAEHASTIACCACARRTAWPRSAWSTTPRWTARWTSSSAMPRRIRACASSAIPTIPGFARGLQPGRARKSTAPWLAFVNPDCMVETDTLVAAARCMRDALAGDVLLGADLVDEPGVRDGAARRRDPDFGGDARGDAARSARSRRSGCAARTTPRALQRVDAVSGALMLMPRALFDRVGGFDEGYRLHAEDLDLCRRARDAGAMVAVANDVRVRARARRVQPRAAGVRGMAQASRAVALFPQVRGAAARPVHARARCSRRSGRGFRSSSCANPRRR